MDGPNRFEVSDSEIPAGKLVELQGELDAASAPKLTRAFEELTDREGYSHIVVDAQALTFIDVAGVRALHEAYSETHEQGSRFNVVPSPLMRRVLDLMGLTPPIRLFDSVEEAIRDLRSVRREETG